MRKKIFISIPYGLDPKVQAERVRMNNAYVRRLILDGHIPVSPIIVGTTAFQGEDTGNVPYPYWIQLSVSYMEGVDEIHIITCEGWEHSQGVQIEREIGRVFGVPIHLIDPSTI